MTHAQIAANARKPYADAIRDLQGRHDALIAAADAILRAVGCMPRTKQVEDMFAEVGMFTAIGNAKTALKEAKKE